MPSETPDGSRRPSPRRDAPRVVVAGTGSGVGKTTVACGLIAALRARGRIVQGHKVGPDYIDPSHHALASGRPPRNLDAFLAEPARIAPLFLHGAAGADLSVIEGVMGLFDGASASDELASTAQVAKLLRAPVLLVVDAGAMARSAAALVHGFRTFDPALDLAGVILNRVGSEGHAAMLREALAGVGVEVVGALRREDAVATPERHLGLVPAGEREPRAAAALQALAALTERSVDLDAVERIARGAPALDDATTPWSPEREVAGGAPVRIAIARGPAFAFHYTENLELLEAGGGELCGFDPTRDEQLPDGCDALLLAGGFPEVYGAELAANERMRAEVAALARSGRPVLAECGGLLYLARELDDEPMCDVLPLTGAMGSRLTLGYRDAVARTPTPWLTSGTRVRGHEFHYSTVAATAAGTHPAWTLSAGSHSADEGIVVAGVQASYLHVHWAAHPELATGFLDAARRISSWRVDARWP